ncbi:hypothetical protein SPRG_14555 [Saprolegnia parasitica CBS 223.65]|uniref:BZIP domain-containing protein n=1 Tax=Saprolegnia parasitica (strain CBS 223.65) TaxID=695850 RepID=A0A067BS86_SAPPC|nr:hypothetical protein SPRG_14555 [Saprolegnia parasitica CBS 223.65]KDO19655.1 hypothetical protein SPRG_14555 [Saprolegnia parasitica CBS 223.65]|eukprot:XP_012209655.1 hypothetical protein SPRG_14555 [Saprolegnia parasitica CBS 223.65]
MRSTKPARKKPSVHRQTQCRNNQRRYRAEARAHLEFLEGAVQSLGTETARLEGQCDSLSMAVQRLPPPPLVVSAHLHDIARCREYWLVFEHGYAIHDMATATAQVAMLRSLMHHDVEVMGAKGVEKVISNWTQYARCFRTLQKVGSAWDVVVVDESTRIVKGVGTITLRIGRETIGALCPQLLANEPLMQRIVGQEIVCPCTQLFYMTLLEDRVMVTRVETDLNMTVGLMALLGSLRDVSDVMTGVQLAPDAELTCWIPPMPTSTPPMLHSAYDCR